MKFFFFHNKNTLHFAEKISKNAINFEEQQAREKEFFIHSFMIARYDMMMGDGYRLIILS